MRLVSLNNIIDNYFLKNKINNYYTYKLYMYNNYFRSSNVGIFEGFYYTLFTIKRYFFLGLIISILKKGSNSSIILRNVLGNCLIETKYLFFNPLIFSLRISKLNRVFVKKSKLFFLLNLPFLFRINKLVLREFYYSK
jgi:Ribosomal protein L19